MRRLWVMLFALALASGSVTRSEAAVIWDYEIINNNQVVGPNDPFGIQVRFYNNSSAGESFGLISSGANFEVNSWAYGAPDVYDFTVSGLKVVQSWLSYRMKNPKGKKSSPLDDIRPERWTGQFTTELLELLWILEATIAGYHAQARLLSAVVRRATIRL